MKGRPRVLTLSLDPGITTGWALLDDKGAILGSGNWKPEELDEGLEYVIRQVNRQGLELEAVVEIMAVGRQGPLAVQLEYVRMTIDRIVVQTFGLDVSRYAPGEWKTSRVAARADLPAKWDGLGLTQHQKDAVVMGRYRIHKRRNAIPGPRWGGK